MQDGKHVLSLDEARDPRLTLTERRADIVHSAARGQGPTFIAAKLDLLVEHAAAEGAHRFKRLLDELGEELGVTGPYDYGLLRDALVSCVRAQRRRDAEIAASMAAARSNWEAGSE